jgi:arylsulfatase A-like enzyme/Tfp pilus assembly protein PilF
MPAGALLDRHWYTWNAMGKLRIAAALAVGLLAAAPVHTATRPSVLLITLDTTRADHIGCYGAAFAATPVLDALARTGTRFDLALSPVPLTFPAHASLLTARVPRRHGVRDNALFRLDAKIPVLAESFKRAGYRTAAFVSAAVLDHGLGIARGFDVYDDDVRVGDRRAFNYEERAASQTTDAALGRIAGLEPPFFLWVHYFDPHLPYVPPEPFRTQFKDRPYDGEIAFMDREIGRLLDAVKKKGAPLLIVAAGDHGEGLGDHGEAAHGVFLYQATQRVPLLFAGPGIPAGKTVARNVGLVDVAPTILDLAGLPPLPGADGRSLTPLLGGGKEPAVPDYEMETFFPRFAYGWAPLRALVRGPLKFVDAPRRELYDFTAGRGEKDDLVVSREKDASRLAAALAELTAGDAPRQAPFDPGLAEQQRRLESLGYAGGSGKGGAARGPAVDPKDGVVWLADLEAARRALQLGNPRDGIAPLERLLGRNPGNVNAMLTLVQCRLAVNDADGAVATARVAVSLSPDNDMAWFNLAGALAEKGRSDPKVREEARAAYEKALALDPRQVDIYQSYAALLMAERRPGDALSLLERARQAGVRDPDVETELGLLELARKAPDAARAAFERAIALNPGAAAALENLGRLAFLREDHGKAVEYYNRALEASPSAALARTLGSILLYKLDDRPRALKAFRKALSLTPPGAPEAADLNEIIRELEASAVGE